MSAWHLSAPRRAPGPSSACTPGVGGWHCGERSSRAVSLGKLHGTQEAERVCRSVALAVLAALLLGRFYGRDEALTQAWGLCKRKARCRGEGARDVVRRP